MDKFYEYFTSKGGAWVANAYSMDDLLKRVKKGDVVQLRDSGGNWYHSIFITGYNNDGEMAYCGHSDPRYDRALNKITGVNVFRILSFD